MASIFYMYVFIFFILFTISFEAYIHKSVPCLALKLVIHEVNKLMSAIQQASDLDFWHHAD